MTLQTRSSTPATAGVCADCGAAAHGNFCSSCGADLRQSSLRFLGQAASPVRRSFPAVYLKILRAPIRQTVAFAEDPSYRGYISFALAGIAIYLLFVVPIVLRTVAPPGTNVSDSMLTLMKILSQVGVYVGMAMAFLLAFAVFRLFAPQKRPFHAYFKLYCLALGFMAPIYGIYEFAVRSLLGGTGLSSFNAQMSLDAWSTPTAWVSVALMVLVFAYFIGIHRRFWNMPVWKAAPLYLATSFVSGNASFHLMWYVGWYSAYVLTAAGIVKI
ncbi:MAG: hypothetical protein H7Y62_12775 [Hyphomicrobium sp.]|nr:hypothetical protein [Hyphomicrobium sp.]